MEQLLTLNNIRGMWIQPFVCYLLILLGLATDGKSMRWVTRIKSKRLRDGLDLSKPQLWWLFALVIFVSCSFSPIWSNEVDYEMPYIGRDGWEDIFLLTVMLPLTFGLMVLYWACCFCALR